MPIQKQALTFLNSLLFFVTLGLSLYNASHFLTLSGLYLQYPFEIDWGEGPNALFFDQLQNFGHFYFSLEDFPYSYATYPPLFFIAQKLTFLFLPNPLLSGRLLSIISTLLLFVVLFKVCHQVLKNRLFAVLFSLQFLGVWFIYFWAPLNRIDMFACLLDLAGIYCFLKYYPGHPFKKYLPVLFFTLTFLTKQNMIFGFAAVMAGILFYRKDYRTAAIYTGIYFSLLLLSFLYLDTISAGEATKHLFGHTAQRTLCIDKTTGGWLLFLMTLWVFTALALSFSKVEEMIRSRFSILWFYWIFNAAIIFMVGIPESNINYLIPSALATVLGAALAASLWTAGAKFESIKTSILLTLILLQSFSLSYLTDYLTKRMVLIGSVPGYYYAYSESGHHAIQNLIAKEKGNVLSEDLTPLILNKKTVFLGPLPPSGMGETWVPGKVIAGCEQKKFSLIVAGSRLLGIPGLKECLKKNYKPEATYTLANQIEFRSIYRAKMD